MRYTSLCLILFATALLGACAHPMIIKPDVAKISSAPLADHERIPKAIGFYIPDADRARQVTTPGGGGDKVTYSPYADLEVGLYKVLSDVFQSVTVLKSRTEATNTLAYILQPEISTTSSSTGTFTWMATDFAVTLKCMFNALDSRPVTTVSVTGTGHAPYEEVKADFSLAGERASLDALTKLRTALTQNPELRK